MSIEKKLLGTTSGGDGPPNVEKVFSTYLYEGTGSAQTITNGIDLDGEGGMVWIRGRDQSWNGGLVWDTTMSPYNNLWTNTTDVLTAQDTGNGISSATSTGFSIGNTSWYVLNASGGNYASWTFRKAPRFFDVVTYTGNGVSSNHARTDAISHNLGVVPGFVIIKRLDAASEWTAAHRVDGTTGSKLYFNLTNDGDTNIVWANMFTDTTFRMNWTPEANFNVAGSEYVAYLFAHDPDGENDDGMIACGSYTGTGAGGNAVSLGWEPQYVMLKRSSNTSSWFLFDTLRGFGADTSVNSQVLYADTSGTEGSLNSMGLNADGFVLDDGGGYTNGSGETYIYMAIRAPMMVEPEAGTDVFAVSTSVSTNPDWVSGFAPDMGIYRYTLGTNNFLTSVRLTQGKYLRTNDTSAEYTDSNASSFDYSNGFGSNVGTSQPSDSIGLLFKRAKGFFDVVAYTGNATLGRTVNHSLGVVPEMMWVKNRSNTQSWQIYHKDIASTPVGSGGRILLDTSAGFQDSDSYWADTDPTSAVFSVGDGDPNVNSNTYIAYLFATLDGVSKCGSFTGNGSSQNIACGFSAGARFVLIKRTDNNGDWYIWDTERGIVTGNDPHLSLNTTSAEVTGDDSIDPQSAGFTVNQVSATNINVTSASYIFLAIA